MLAYFASVAGTILQVLWGYERFHNVSWSQVIYVQTPSTRRSHAFSLLQWRIFTAIVFAFILLLSTNPDSKTTRVDVGPISIRRIRRWLDIYPTSIRVVLTDLRCILALLQTSQHCGIVWTLMPWSCFMMDHSEEASSVISVNALTDKAEITHWRIDGQSGDDGGGFLRMIRHAACMAAPLLV